MIQVICPKCHQQYEVGDEFAGASASCDVCNEQFQIPSTAIAVKDTPVRRRPWRKKWFRLLLCGIALVLLASGMAVAIQASRQKMRVEKELRREAMGIREFEEGTRLENEDMPKLAVEHFQKGAELGHSGCQYKIGMYYRNGEVVLKSIPRAAAWMGKAAEAGHAEAQAEYAAYLLFCERSPEKAAIWVQESQKQDCWHGSLLFIGLLLGHFGPQAGLTEEDYIRANNGDAGGVMACGLFALACLANDCEAWTGVKWTPQ